MANSINGRVIDERNGQPVPGLTVEARIKQNSESLGSAQTNADGTFFIKVDPRRFRELVASRENVSFRVIGPNGEEYTDSNGAVWSGSRPDEVVSVVVRPQEAEPTEPDVGLSVQGVVTDAAGVAAVGLDVEVWDRFVDGMRPLGTATTGADGRYVVSYDEAALSGKPAADLLIRVVADTRPLVESDTLFQAPRHATVDLVVERADVPTVPEYDRLLAQAKPLLGNQHLGAVSADGVGYLAGRMDWDARSIAMAAQAEKLSEQTKISASHFYALMRSGLPGDLDHIYRLDDETIRDVLSQAEKDGIITADDDIDSTLSLYREPALERLRNFRPEGKVSSLGEMLDVRLNADQRQIFLETYRSTHSDPDKLWASLTDRGFDERTIRALQTDAVLGEFTRQNAPVVKKLVEKTNLKDVAELADHGFYREEAWHEVVSGNDVPEGLTLEQYTSGLALQVTTQFPARVTAHLVSSDKVSVPPEAKDEITGFLAQSSANTSLGFVPVKTWDGFTDLSDKAQEGALKVERLFQISPSNDSMVALSTLGIDSALQVMRHSPTGFVEKFGDAFPSAMEARLTYAKAQQVHTTALNIATQYLTDRGSPNVYAMSGQLERQPPEPESIASATLEDLYGSMDYCSCEHCRSVLSPAAYLVELLEFIDVADEPHSGSNPLDELFARRPDLQHLGLSCENTHTTLPYLDLVLEILEHWVVNGSLEDYEGHDTRPDAATADLLAEPDFVSDSAYDKTRDAVYPPPLPFDAPLTHLRAVYEVWDTSLAAAFDALDDPENARREWLGLNPTELSLLTDTNFRALPELYGEPATMTLADLNGKVGNAKEFSRRIGVTYVELVDLLRSPFVNPGSVLVPLLEALQVPIEEIQKRFDGTLSDAEFTNMLPPDLSPSPYDGDVLAWLDTNRNLLMGTITFTDLTPPGEDSHDCDFGRFELRHLLPDMTANRLTEIDHHRLLRFIRLWKKLGWSIADTDTAIAAFLGHAYEPAKLTTTTIDLAFPAMLDRLAGFHRLIDRLALSVKERDQWLALFEPELGPATRLERLAPLLKQGTTDLSNLIEISGIDPFADDLGSDDPSLLRFVDAVALLKSTKIKVADVDYLLRHADPTGKLTPSPAQVERDLAALRNALTAVDAELAVPAATADLATAAARMALVYDTGVVDRFIALIAGTTTYAVPLDTVVEILPEKLVDKLDEINKEVRIDPFQNTLTSEGPLSELTRTALDTATAALKVADLEEISSQANLAAFKMALKDAFQGLQDAADADLKALVNEFPELKNLLFETISLTNPVEQAAAIVAGLLPELLATQRITGLRTELASMTKAEVELIDALMSSRDILHSDGDSTKSFLEDFTGLATQPELSANGTYELLLDPPASADYLFYVAAPKSTSVTLTVDGDSANPAISATVNDSADELRSLNSIDLIAGRLVPITLTLADLPADQAVELRWRTKTSDKAKIPSSRIYDTGQYEQARRTLLRVQKAVQAAKALGLSAGEIAYFGAIQTATTGLWNCFPVDSTSPADDVKAQWKRLAWVLWYVQLKKNRELESEISLGILRKPDEIDAQGKLKIAGVMGWAESDLDAMLSKFGFSLNHLDDLEKLRLVTAALNFIESTQQPAADLIAWTVPKPDGALVRSVRDTLKARMDLASWRESMRSVSDAVRNARRDALVAYILHHDNPSPEIVTPEKLYEHFLVDVEMDACRQTSRIRLALSTVQLFVQRCLLNLEPKVSPSSINAEHWSWMRRYRVWEANRKIFLYPENWLEPELRDNKSPFFRELESELLKSDITQDLAELAYLNYLRKLDDIAHLEVAGAFLEEKTSGTTEDDVLHVIGRTLGTTREHWYRRYERGYWTPWEKIGLNIEGDIVVPVVWKKRLFIFWVSTLVQAHGALEGSPEDSRNKPWSDAAKVDATVTLHRGEYYNGTWQSPKTTETAKPLTFYGLSSFDPQLIRCRTKVYTPTSETEAPSSSERLEFGLAYKSGTRATGYTLTFTSPNSQPHLPSSRIIPIWTKTGFHASLLELGLTLPPKFNANQWTYSNKTFSLQIEQPSEPKTPVQMTVLTKTGNLMDGFRVRPTLQYGVNNPWEMPLFYTDEHSVFFLNGDEQLYREVKWNYYDDLIVNGNMLYTSALSEQPVKPEVPELADFAINPTLALKLPGNSRFEYDGATFDASGSSKMRLNS